MEVTVMNFGIDGVLGFFRRLIKWMMRKLRQLMAWLRMMLFSPTTDIIAGAVLGTVLARAFLIFGFGYILITAGFFWAGLFACVYAVMDLWMHTWAGWKLLDYMESEVREELYPREPIEPQKLAETISGLPLRNVS